MQSYFYDARDIAPILRDKKKILLVHGRAYEGSVLEGVLQDYNVIHFTSFTPNPDYEDVKKGAHLLKDEGADFIVAVGGGSAIDVAKGIKLLSSGVIEGDLNSFSNALCSVKMMAVPTTAGSGSEATAGAVMYKEGVKISLSGRNTLPEYVLLDYNFLYSLPIYQKKCTVMDALCQAIESMWSVKSCNESIEYSEKAIKLIKENYKTYISESIEKNDKNDEVLKNILLASNYAGKAINITATTAAHAMSYILTKKYDLPHGNAVSVCMVQAWREIDKALDGSGSSVREIPGREKLQRIMEQIEKSISFEEFMEIYESFNLKKTGESKPDKKALELTSSVNIERLGNFPVELDTDRLCQMYERILNEKSIGNGI